MCLNAVGVKPGDSRDYKGLNRFFPFITYQHTNPDQENKDWWYWKNIRYLLQGVFPFFCFKMYCENIIHFVKGVECCSDEAASFHYVTPIEFYITQYLAYTVSPFSVTHVNEAPKTKQN